MSMFRKIVRFSSSRSSSNLGAAPAPGQADKWSKDSVLRTEMALRLESHQQTLEGWQDKCHHAEDRLRLLKEETTECQARVDACRSSEEVAASKLPILRSELDDLCAEHGEEKERSSAEMRQLRQSLGALEQRIEEDREQVEAMQRERASELEAMREDARRDVAVEYREELELAQRSERLAYEESRELRAAVRDAERVEEELQDEARQYCSGAAREAEAEARLRALLEDSAEEQHGDSYWDEAPWLSASEEEVIRLREALAQRRGLAERLEAQLRNLPLRRTSPRAASPLREAPCSLRGLAPLRAENERLRERLREASGPPELRRALQDDVALLRRLRASRRELEQRCRQERRLRAELERGLPRDLPCA